MRIRFKRWFWRFLGLFGLLLVGTIIYAGYVWYYPYGPYRKMCNYQWLHNHSELAYWHAMEDAMEQAIKKETLPHDAGFYAGKMGDKEWARRLFEGVKSGELEIGGFECWDGHVVVALADFTNQNIPDDDRNAWIAWWKENKDKTQDEWIRDGFQDIDITVTEDLTNELVIELLVILGSSPPAEFDPEGIETEASEVENVDGTAETEEKYSNANRFNAYRWLRDHRFEASQLKYDDIPDEHHKAVFYGMATYVDYSYRYPKDEIRYGTDFNAIFNGPTRKIIDYGIPLFFCIGLFFVFLSRRVLAKKRVLDRDEMKSGKLH